jgi:hypothetical protein
MMGTFGGALDARQIDASNGKLTADVIGEVEQEEGVLVIRRIHVAMRARAWHLRDALPPVSHVARGDPAHIILRAGGSGSGVLVTLMGKKRARGSYQNPSHGEAV